MARKMLMHSELRFPEDMFSNDICQWHWIMLYGSIIGSMICSLYYPLLKYGQGEGLSQCQKILATVMFGVFQYMF